MEVADIGVPQPPSGFILTILSMAVLGLEVDVRRLCRSGGAIALAAAAAVIILTISAITLIFTLAS